MLWAKWANLDVSTVKFQTLLGVRVPVENKDLWS